MKYSHAQGVKPKRRWPSWLLIVAVIIAIYMLVTQSEIIVGGVK